MSINIQNIGRKLLQARNLQNLSINTVEQSTGISGDRLSFIEKGELRPSGDELLILANYYRHDFRDFLLEDSPEPFKQSEILYRKYGDSFTSTDRRAIQEFLYLCEIEAYLESEMGIRKNQFLYTPQGTYFKGHGEKAAPELRNLLSYKENEIRRDIFKDFRDIGIHIFRRRLNNRDISGLFIEHPIAKHCILINYDEDIYRQKFSVCHEVAHVIFDSKDAVVVSFHRSSSKYDIQDLKEIRANRFASCYLMPPNILPKVSSWTEELAVEWAQKLRVSTSALATALQEAKMIDAATARIIKSVKVSSNNKIDSEIPSTFTEKQRERKLALLEHGLSDYYVNLCFDAYREGLISAGRLSESFLATYSETKEISIIYGRPINYAY